MVATCKGSNVADEEEVANRRADCEPEEEESSDLFRWTESEKASGRFREGLGGLQPLFLKSQEVQKNECIDIRTQ